MSSLGVLPSLEIRQIYGHLSTRLFLLCGCSRPPPGEAVIELSYFLVCQLITGTPSSLPVRWLWGGKGRECLGISREAFSYPLDLLQPGSKYTPPAMPGITVHLPTLTTSHTWQNPAHNRQVEWQEHLAFHARVPSLAVRSWIFRWRAFPCRRVMASLQKAGSLPATFLTGLVRLSTPSLPAAETSAPRGLPHRKVTEKVTLISEPATESSLTPAPD